MARLLYIQASPRGERSHSSAVGDAFAVSYGRAHPDDEVVTVNLFDKNLPSFDGFAMQAKYAILGGKDKTPEEAEAWREIEEAIGEFTSADKYVLASPMWNFGIPYRLKQYFDILIQPGYTFSYDPEKGYSGLVVGKPAALILARGGEYDGPPYDFQQPYLELLLGFMGFSDVASIVVQPTLMGGPEEASRARAAAIEEAAMLASSF